MQEVKIHCFQICTSQHHLLVNKEIPADGEACVVLRRGPAGVQDDCKLLIINSIYLHLDVQPLVYLYFKVVGCVEGNEEVGILIGDHSDFILSLA